MSDERSREFDLRNFSPDQVNAMALKWLAIQGIAEGKVINAIKDWRSATDGGLRESKDYIERLRYLPGFIDALRGQGPINYNFNLDIPRPPAPTYVVTKEMWEMLSSRVSSLEDKYMIQRKKFREMFNELSEHVRDGN